MITEDYCSFETAKLLKEKGFNDPCIATYNSVTKNFEVEEVYQDWNTRWKAYFSAPTLQMAMKWLREVHSISIELITMHRNCWGYYVCKILDNTIEDLHDRNYFNTYEEAVEAALKYCLKNLI